MARNTSRTCGTLGQLENFGPVDVCKLEHGHAGPHEGAHRGMKWTTARKGGPARVVEKPRLPLGVHDIDSAPPKETDRA